MKLTKNSSGPLMDPKRMFYVMVTGVVLVAGLGIAALVLGNSFLQKRSDNLVVLKLQYRVPEENQTALKQAKADIQKYTELGNTAKSIVPQDKDQARSVREIINYADQTIDPKTKKSIKILSITFPGSNLGQTTTVVAKPATGSGDTATTTPKVVTPPISQVQTVEGIPGVFSLPITVESDPAQPITYSQLTAFLASLEKNRRTAQVTQITITPQQANNVNGLSFSLTINVYIKP